MHTLTFDTHHPQVALRYLLGLIHIRTALNTKRIYLHTLLLK